MSVSVSECGRKEGEERYLVLEAEGNGLVGGKQIKCGSFSLHWTPAVQTHSTHDTE